MNCQMMAIGLFLMSFGIETLDDVTATVMEGVHFYLMR